MVGGSSGVDVNLQCQRIGQFTGTYADRLFLS